MKPKKSLGQNFLMHAKTAERIADGAVLTKEDAVLEIGPGTGMLTTALLARARKIIAVEADRELAARLRESFSANITNGTLELVESDIREFDPSSINEPYKLVANIPYYITGEIIRTFLTTKNKPSSMTLLVQKEVAERIARSEKGSLLSIAVQTYGTPKYLFTVPRGAFFPAPNVDSAVLTVTDIHAPFKDSNEEDRFFEILRAGFAHKRKFLASNLKDVAESDLISAAFTAESLSPKVRAEELGLQTWKNLAERLK